MKISPLLIGVVAVVAAIFLLGYHAPVGNTMSVTPLTLTGPLGTCSDSDGGDNIYVNGTTIGCGNTYVDRCYNGQVIEYICQAFNGCAAQAPPESCPNGYYCSNGACVTSMSTTTLPPQPLCTSIPCNSCFDFANTYLGYIQPLNTNTCTLSQLTTCYNHVITLGYNANIHSGACNLVTTTTSPGVVSCSIPYDSSPCNSITDGEIAVIANHWLIGSGINDEQIAQAANYWLRGV